MELSTSVISDEYFVKLVEFLSDYQCLFVKSNTEYLKKDVLKFSLITDMSELNLTNEQLNKIPVFEFKDHWPESLKKFINDANSLTINFENISEVSNLNQTYIKRINIKKQYEIQNLSVLIHDFCHKSNIKALVDLGSGLGYLSQLLSQSYGYKVLGIEGDPERVKSAQRRQAELYPDSSVKYVQHFIEESSGANISKFLVDNLNSFEEDVALIGLHACADLTITSISLFFSIPKVKKLIIMPCCYHKLKNKNENEFHNIPLSQKLLKAYKNNNFINRCFLRLACNQTSSRWLEMTKNDHFDHSYNMFQRAVLECLLKNNERALKAKSTQITSEKLTFQNLMENYQIMDNQTNKNIKWNKEHEYMFAEIRKGYPKGEEESELLTCLQTTIQSLCENLILVDRLAYVEEVAFEMNIKVNSCIKRLPNDKLSPRCFIFIVEKL